MILHIRYTARPAGDPLASQATKELAQMLDTAGASSQALMFCLRFDFPNEWALFTSGSAPFQAVLKKFFFPYMVQGAKLTIDNLALYAASGQQVAAVTPLSASDLAALTTGLAGPDRRRNPHPAAGPGRADPRQGSACLPRPSISFWSELSADPVTCVKNEP